MFTPSRNHLLRLQNVRSKTDRATLNQIIRVDHAGELGADRIYAGQMAVLGTTSKAPLIKHMWEQEKHHKATFEDLIRKHRVRPTIMTPIWNVAGFILGASTALLGEKAAMACTVAVETVIVDHYNDQLRTLLQDPDCNKELMEVITKFRDEEQEHHDTGIDQGAEQTPFYQLLTSVIKTGCKVRKRRGEIRSEKPLPVDIIQKSIGIFGRWHLGVCFLLFLCKFPVAFHQLSIIFLAPAQEFRCAIEGIDKCSRNCTSYEYDTSTFETTIISEWNLVCARRHKASWAQTVTMLGILVGNVVFGFLSDKFGRKIPLILEVAIQAIAGVATAFVPWYSAFLILRFFTAAATGGTMITSFVLIMEIVGVKRRTIVSILYQIPTYLGHALLSPLSYFFRKWRIFQLAISVPSIILLSYYWFVPESPRWLLLLGKRDKAIKMLTRAAKRNRLPTDLIEQNVDEYLTEETQLNAKKGNIFDLFRSPIIRTYTLVICYNWVVCGLCYFGLAQYIGNMGQKIFINVAISGLVQIPSAIFACWSTNAWGRKWTLVVANVLAGLPMLLMIFTPSNPPWINIFLVLCGIFGICLAFPTVYIYAGEIYPTSLRNVGVGFSSMTARIGSMIAPFVANLKSEKSWLPPFIFGVAPLIGAALCYFLPETLNCELPRSIEEAEIKEIIRRRERSHRRK